MIQKLVLDLEKREVDFIPVVGHRNKLFRRNAVLLACIFPVIFLTGSVINYFKSGLVRNAALNNTFLDQSNIANFMYYRLYIG
jgi:hypothetical protein